MMTKIVLLWGTQNSNNAWEQYTFCEGLDGERSQTVESYAGCRKGEEGTKEGEENTKKDDKENF